MRERFGEAWDRLFAPAVAHRGLWSKDGPPENSLGAFELACEAGYGIELDVQLSSDGEAMVFHDGRPDADDRAGGPHRRPYGRRPGRDGARRVATRPSRPWPTPWLWSATEPWSRSS